MLIQVRVGTGIGPNTHLAHVSVAAGLFLCDVLPVLLGAFVALPVVVFQSGLFQRQYGRLPTAAVARIPVVPSLPLDATAPLPAWPHPTTTFPAAVAPALPALPRASSEPPPLFVSSEPPAGPATAAGVSSPLPASLVAERLCRLSSHRRLLPPPPPLHVVPLLLTSPPPLLLLYLPS